ncbi:hypothetical protein [Rhodobacter maris]|uniref:Uncharacterized protein n=1 Tax=Rhodobacter maris TaxID=446682 RepID=A0A285T086_9RHOB|nr:hypothetical protein [Rhodobacter maris]SOC14371.1 hypothetical protein SAMN05877831_1125 [Rhodobacter maris]
MTEHLKTTPLKQKEAGMALDIIKKPKAATPAPFMMTKTMFTLWINKIRLIGDFDFRYPSAYLSQEQLEGQSDWEDVEIYLDTTEGLVTARHEKDSELVWVTITPQAPWSNIEDAMHWLMNEAKAA